MKRSNKCWLALIAVFAMGTAQADPIEITLVGTLDFFASGFGLSGLDGDTISVVVSVDSTVTDVLGGQTFSVFNGNLTDIVWDFGGTLYSLADVDSFGLPFFPYFSLAGGFLDLSYFSGDFNVSSFANLFFAFDPATFGGLSGTLAVESIAAVPEPGTLTLLGLGLLGLAARRRRKLIKS